MTEKDNGMAERADEKASALAFGAGAGRRSPGRLQTGEELKAELDDLLDEIDEVLEDNAEEFVKSYVQKGGQ